MNIYICIYYVIKTTIAEFDMKLALSACACLIDYLKLVEDDSNMGEYTIQSHELSQYMRLDASAVRALNLIETSEGLIFFYNLFLTLI